MRNQTESHGHDLRRFRMGEEEIKQADRRSQVHGGRRMEAWAGRG